AAQPMAHWHDVLERAHITFGVVRSPREVVADAQLAANDIVVPLHGTGVTPQTTVSSPFRVHNVAKVAPMRAPELGEHNDEVLDELGFGTADVEHLRASGAIPPVADLAAKTPGAA